MVSVGTSNGSHQDADNILIGLGLLDHQMTPCQTSASPETVILDPVSTSSSSGVDHVPKSNSSSQEGSEQASYTDRRDWKLNALSHTNLRTMGSGGLFSSPSFPRYNNRPSSRKAPTIAKVFASGFFVDETAEGKRIRGLSNLFKPRSANRSSGKGERKGKHGQMKAYVGPGCASPADDGNRRNGSAEQDHLKQVRTVFRIVHCQHSHYTRFKDCASD